MGAPLALFWAVNHGALGSWWIYDDPCLLRSAWRHGAFQHLWDPDVWRPLSGTLLMPWSLVSLGIDGSLFGLAPKGFYAHQLISFSMLLVVVHGFSRRFLSPAFAAVAVSLLVASPASFAVAQKLMNRHYLEGLIFAVGSLWLFCRSLRSASPGHNTAVGVGLYLLACAAKEVYVPLVVILPLIPIADLRRRVRRFWPWAVGTAAYVAWRIYMLGWLNSFPTSAYGARDAAFEPSTATMILGLQGVWPVVLVGATVVLAVGIVIRTNRRTLALVVGLVAVVTLPLLPVGPALAPRHLLLPVLLAAFAVAAALQRLDGGRPWLRPAGFLLVAVAMLALYRSPVHAHHAQTVERYRAEGEVVLSSDDQTVLLSRLSDGFYLGCLADLRQIALDLPPGPAFVSDGCLASRYPDKRLVRIDDGKPSPDAPPPACDQSRPLDVELRHDPVRGRIEWELGPSTAGRYQVMMVFSKDPTREPAGIGPPIPVTPAGSLPWTLSEPLRLIVRYRSPDGWTTFSPILSLAPGHEVELRRP